MLTHTVVTGHLLILLPAAQIQIDTDGAIETPTVRKAIMTTMEGGRDAFELRGRKYAFETGEEKGGASG